MSTLIDTWLQQRWYGTAQPGPVLGLLGRLFRGAVRIRRTAYRRGWKAQTRLPVPVIVVGNLTVGGTGKTPLVIALVEQLRAAGYRPGIISRGYGGARRSKPEAVPPDGDPAVYGDEPVLLARRTGAPVWVFSRRGEAGMALLAATDCDVLIADDGLQHYALARDIEIAVIDGARRFGNGRCLPAGPLREPACRLREVDFVVVQGCPLRDEFELRLIGETAVNAHDVSDTRPLADFAGQTVHGVAGIGNPARFFAWLEQAGLNVTPHPFPDHHRYRERDFAFANGEPCLLTEKDAVKCSRLNVSNLWYVPVTAVLPPIFGDDLLNLLKTKTDGQKTA